MGIEPINPEDERIASIIVDGAINVHRALGPGLLESVYEVCLAHELRKRGLEVQRQVPTPIQYDGLQFEEGFRCDLPVEGRIICEIKSVQELHPIFTAQVLTHLRRMNLRLAFLINFNVKLVKDGLHRLAR